MEKKTHLHRLRVLFNEDGSLDLVETVTKSVIVDGEERHPAGETFEVFDLAKVDGGLIEALLANLDAVREATRQEADAKAAAAAKPKKNRAPKRKAAE